MMAYSNDAADQVVRLTLDGVEVAAKISGKAAEKLATMMIAILRDEKKTRGKARLNNILRNGNSMKVFSIRDDKVREFCRVARRYGALYCILKDKDANDGLTDIMVRAEDVAMINRIFERYGFNLPDAVATVNTGDAIELDFARDDLHDRTERSVSPAQDVEYEIVRDDTVSPVPMVQDAGYDAASLDDTYEFWAVLMEQDRKMEEAGEDHTARGRREQLPTGDRMENGNPSDPFFRDETDGDIIDLAERRSVREELREITERRAALKEAAEHMVPQQPVIPELPKGPVR